MRAIQITGYKKSGKTTLVAALAKIFEQQGIKVSILKFTHHGFDAADTDTAKLSAPGRIVGGISENQSVIYWNEQRYFLDMLPLLNADLLIVEGGKKIGLMPRIICLDNMESINDLKPELGIASFGAKAAQLEQILPVPHFTFADIDSEQKNADLVKIILEKAFILPGLDCMGCGHDNCATLAAQIISGKATIQDCTALGSKINICINGQPIGLNAFTAGIIEGGIRGMMQSLKGYAPGKIEITLPK